MIDAYTIGIKIALEDGVSAGVASIKQDLLALDRAIQATAAGLLALRRLGQQASVVPGIEASPAASHAPAIPPLPAATPPAPEATSALDTNVLSAPIPVPLSPQESRPNAQDAVQSQATPTEPPPFMPQAAREDPQPRPMQPAGAQPAAPLTPLQQNTTQNAPGQPSPAQPRQIADFAPRPLQLQREFSAVPLPPASPGTNAMPEPPFLPPPKLPSATPLPAAPTSPSVRLDLSRPPAAFAQGMATQSSAPASSATSAPARMPDDRSSPAQPGRQAPERWSAVPPPSRSEAATARVSGDVMLDGSRLGRWISDSLTRMAERVPSGSTGIDPRASVGWPAIQAD